MTQFGIDYANAVQGALSQLGVSLTFTEKTASTFDDTTQTRSIGTDVVYVVTVFPPYMISVEDAEISNLEVGMLVVVFEGVQPFDLDNRVTLVFDGRIYTLTGNKPLFADDLQRGIELFFVKGPE